MDGMSLTYQENFLKTHSHAAIMLREVQEGEGANLGSLQQLLSINLQYQNSEKTPILLSLEYKSRDSYSRLIEFPPKFFYSNLDFE